MFLNVIAPPYPYDEPYEVPDNTDSEIDMLDLERDSLDDYVA